MNSYEVSLFRHRNMGVDGPEGMTMSVKRFTSLKSAVYYALSRHSRTKEQYFASVFVYVNNGDAAWKPFYGITRKGDGPCYELCYGRKCQ